jgi:CheY-like chemotaxis protein
MPDGGRIDVETHSLPDGFVELEIRDTGTGMAGETLARAFEPFFTTKALGQGSGLGLSTVYGIVKQSDGTISVDSKQGMGTRFQIRLPSVRRGIATQDAAAGRARDAAPAPRETILVVEDETSVRRIVQQALERRGYAVMTARDGEEALELLEGCRRAPDLVVADLVMPRMGGRELAIKLHETRPGLKVLFMSGYAGPRVSDELVLELGSGLLQKPFSLLELTRKVDEVIGL